MRATHLLAPIRYYDERHYEIFAMRALMRDVQYNQTTSSSFNGSYDFSFKSLIDRRYDSNKSYLIRLNVRDSSKRRFLSSELDTVVTVTVVLDFEKNISQEFVGKIISTSSVEHEDHAFIIFNRKGDQTKLILIELHGDFSFESRGASSKQIKQSIKQLMYDEAGVFTDSWLKKLLLAHNSFSNDIQLLYM